MWVLLIVAGLAAIYYYLNAVTYWKKHGVPQGSVTFTFKEMLYLLLQRRSLAETVALYYNMFPNSRYNGLYQFTKPILMIRDPELLKEITVKNFDHFTDHPQFISEDAEPLWARNLLALKGQKWRDMRPILSPSFTSSKMRTIFVLISDCAKTFTEYFLKQHEDTVEVEFSDTFTRFTNDVIGTAAFGIQTNSLEDKNNQFYVMGKKLTNIASGLRNILKLLFVIFFPKLFEILRLSLLDKEATTFFTELVENTIKIRKEKNIVRPDMIHLLMEAQKGTQSNEEYNISDSSFAAQAETDLGQGDKKKLTNMDIAAQAILFFFGGFDSVASLMCFMSYELALNPDIQQRLRVEIEETLKNCEGNLTYEALLKMKYLDMVVSESLRKWPPTLAVDRECTKAYVIQPKRPEERPIHLKEKAVLNIPIYVIHHDPDIYSEPNKFDPERFSEENKGHIDPYTYLPFGLGPRNCIGSRLALLEIKTMFVYLLQNFEIVPTSKSQIPVKLSVTGFNLKAENGFWFGFRKLKQ